MTPEADQNPLDHTPSVTCRDEACRMCGSQATHKVGEEIPHDRPAWNLRHNLTAYVCCRCFGKILGPAAVTWCNSQKFRNEVTQ